MTTYTYDYLDGPVTASFDQPMAVRPDEAEAIIVSAIEAIGGCAVTQFDPTQQPRNTDEGFVGADFRVEFPDGRRVWLSVECPTDDTALPD